MGPGWSAAVATTINEPPFYLFVGPGDFDKVVRRRRRALKVAEGRLQAPSQERHIGIYFSVCVVRFVCGGRVWCLLNFPAWWVLAGCVLRSL